MRFHSRDLVWVFLAAVSILGFQNCGQGFESSTTLESKIFGSLQFTPGSCDVNLESLYRRTYYPVVMQKCSACHTDGPGVGRFGSSNFETSYDDFMRMGRAAVERNLVNPGHQPPWTGPANQGTLDSLQPLWDEAEPLYDDCLNVENGGGAGASSIVTTGKYDSRIIQRTGSSTFTTLTWDLSMDLVNPAFANQAPAMLTVEVRSALLPSGLKGYEFRNPSLRLKAGVTTPLSVAGLRVILNGQLQSQVTTYLQAAGLATSETAVNLSPGAAFGLLVLPQIQATDTIAWSITDIVNSQGMRLGGGTPTIPVPGMTLPPRNPAPTPVTPPTFAELTGNDATKNVFRRACFQCHSAQNPSAGLDLSSSTAAKAGASLILSRMKDSNAPMPPSGLAAIRDRDLVEAWVQSGAP